MRWKDYKSQKIREFAVILCFLEISEAILANSHHCGCLNMSQKNYNTNRYVKVNGERPKWPQSYTKNYRQLRNVESR